MKINRREFVLGAVALSQVAPAQVTADPLQEARDANRHNSEALAKVNVSASVEPAFQFRA